MSLFLFEKKGFYWFQEQSKQKNVWGLVGPRMNFQFPEISEEIGETDILKTIP